LKRGAPGTAPAAAAYTYFKAVALLLIFPTILLP